MTHRKVTWLLFACCAWGLAGCAKISDRSWRFVSAKVDAIALVNEQLLQGEMSLAPDRSGTLRLAADKGPIVSCVGNLRYTATAQSMVDLRCNDGSVSELQISLLSEVKGYGYGRSASAGISLVFGLTNQEAMAYLSLPANKKLVERSTDGLLELQ